MYLNPPFWLIARAVAKIAPELSEMVFLLVTPEWHVAHWINAVTQLSTDWPMQLGDLCSAARSNGASTVRDLTTHLLEVMRQTLIASGQAAGAVESVWLLL